MTLCPLSMVQENLLDGSSAAALPSSTPTRPWWDGPWHRIAGVPSRKASLLCDSALVVTEKTLRRVLFTRLPPSRVYIDRDRVP